MLTIRTISIAIGVVVLVLVVGFGIVLLTDPQLRSLLFGSSQNSGQNTMPTAVDDVISAMRAGNFETALSVSNAIQNDPNMSAEAKALAAYNVLGAEFRVSGDLATRLTDVGNMKRLVLDETLPVGTRVNVLNLLAGQYAISGADEAVFNEIFKDPPFSEYRANLADTDLSARLSARKLSEWSYSMAPTSFAAINIATWYSEQRAFNPSLATSTAISYAKKADEYLKKAQEASIEEAKADTSYYNSARYLVYRYWEAVVIGRLAVLPGPLRAEYNAKYRNAYDEFITFALRQTNALSTEYLHYARMFYAQLLARKGDTAAAKVQLDFLAHELSSMQEPDKSVFLLYLRNEFASRPKGPTWMNLVENQLQYSQNFKITIDVLVKSAI